MAFHARSRLAYPNHFLLKVTFDQNLDRDPLSFLVEEEVTFGTFMAYLRRFIQLKPATGVFVMIQNHMIVPTYTVAMVYKLHGRPGEKVVEVTLLAENTFG